MASKKTTDQRRRPRSQPNRFKFTHQRLWRLPIPETGEVTYHDEHLPGLSLRVLSSNSKTFYILKRVGGRPVRITLGQFLSIDLGKARKLAQIALGKIADNKNPNTAKRKARERGKDLASLYTEYRKAREMNLRVRTLNDYQQILDTKFADWVTRPYQEITREMVVSRFDRITRDSGPAAANLAMRVLRAILNFAEMEPNPVRRLSSSKRWHRDEPRKTLVTDQDIPKWWKAVEGLADGGAGDVCRDYLETLLLTGLRKGEAGRLLIEDVDLEARTLTIPDTKNRHTHTLPMGRMLERIILRRVKAAQSEWVFPAEKRGHLKDPRKGIDLVIKTSGIPSFMPHDLRRTFTTIAESLDIGWLTLKKLLNHKVKNTDVTAGYVVMDVERLRGPMQRIEDAILARAGIIQPAQVIHLSKRKIQEKT